MKCGTYIEWKMAGRKKPVRKMHRAYSPYLVSVQGFELVEGMELCDGNIYPHVELDNDDGGCSCCSSNYIRIQFICDKCATVHQEFPSDEDWYNQFVKDLMNGRNVEEIRSELIQKQIDHQKDVLAFAAKLQKETEAKKAIDLARKANKLKGKV